MVCIPTGVVDVVPRDLQGIRQPLVGLSFQLVLQTTGDLMTSRRLLAAPEVNTTQTPQQDGSIRLTYTTNQVCSIDIIANVTMNRPQQLPQGAVESLGSDL